MRASARTLVSLRPLPVPPMAMMASAVSSCSASSSRASPVPCIVLAKHAPARRGDLAGDQVHGRIDHGVARGAGAHEAHARLADVQMLHPGRSQDGGLNRA